MRMLEQLAPGGSIGWLALEVVAQITAVILAAKIVARMILKRSAAARHRLWLYSLVCILSSPVIPFALDRARISLAIIPWERSRAPMAANVVAPPAESYGHELARSGDAGGEFSALLPTTQTENSTPPTNPPIELASSATMSSFSHQELNIESEIGNRTMPTPASDDVPLDKIRIVIGALVLTWVIGIGIGLVRLIRAGRQLGQLRGRFSCSQLADTRKSCVKFGTHSALTACRRSTRQTR